jgi:hypothetical protein
LTASELLRPAPEIRGLSPGLVVGSECSSQQPGNDAPGPPNGFPGWKVKRSILKTGFIMALILHTYNIVRITDGANIIECTIIKMCLEHAVVKYKGKQYKVPYDLIDKVVGHELLLPFR